MNATDTSTTSTNADIPAAWIGCLHCYNSGRLVGRWFDLTDPDDLAVIEGDDDDPTAPALLRVVHAPHGPSPQCEELWVMDHENLPISGECSPAELVKIAELYDEVTTCDPDAWPAYCAYVHDQYGGDMRNAPDADDFTDSYRGEWGSFQEFADELVDDLGMLDQMPENLRGYFDYAAFARDLAHDYVTIDHGGNVWVYWAN